jgi:S-adenosylmethionine:tRNA ribosyltransferase-isomerase
MQLSIGNEQLSFKAERLSKEGNASTVEFSWNNTAVTFSEIISAVGEIPIPPYLNRSTEASDLNDYQTVYSHIDGSVAAPTAGLHFTDNVLDEISKLGIPRRELTLHVGAGTFQPVKSDEIGDHEMHSEFIAVDRNLIAELADSSRQVIAVGTTSVRTLESLYHAGVLIARNQWNGEVPQWAPYNLDNDVEAENAAAPSVADAMKAILAHLDETNANKFVASTRIIIAPGYRYRVVKGMVTNFHQPRSTLLLLVSAFTNGDWRPIYDYALAHDFRFLSYGDACLLLS